MRSLNPLRILIQMLTKKKPEQTFYHGEVSEPFNLNQCTNGATRCMIPLKCFDAEKCQHGRAR